MQLYVINWSFQNAEDQLFATNEFCQQFKNNKLNQYIEGFEINFIAHTPQNGSGIIICKSQNLSIIYSFLDMWRKSYSIKFDIKPALTNEEIIELNDVEDYWDLN